MPLQKIDIWHGGQIPIIRYRGKFDWLGLYRMIRDWIGSNHYGFEEIRYKDKGDEVEVIMQGDKKVDGMHQYVVTFNIIIRDFKETEEMVSGKKKSMASGRLDLRMSGRVDVDYADKFKGKPWVNKIGQWWLKITGFDTGFLHIDPLTYEIYAFHSELKQFLGLTASSNAF